MADKATQITLTVDPVFAGLYVLQRDFQALLHDDTFPADLSPGVKMNYLRTQALALTDEIHEALAETGWKPWANNPHINREAYKGELADVFIFFMNMMLVADITPAELLEYVKAKQIRNRERQAEGYDGVSTKCPRCKRAYDDTAVLCTNEHDEMQRIGKAWCDQIKEFINADGSLYEVPANHYTQAN